jgi:alpha-galactosidase
LIYTGSFAATTERFSHGFIRVLLGMNPLHTSWKLQPGETFTSPEAVAVYSSEGVGGMSRSYHDLYRNHLSRSNKTFETRPVLLNSWEGLGFDINQTSLLKLADETAGLGISLFVMDDGWFGDKYPRVTDDAGLGDWVPNPDRFPNGLGPYVANVENDQIQNSTKDLQFGIWVEPEMVNPNSTLYHEHPNWAMHDRNYPRSLTRNQLVLNMGMREVQDYIINAISSVIDSANINYIKWDNNRAIQYVSIPTRLGIPTLTCFSIVKCPCRLQITPTCLVSIV